MHVPHKESQRNIEGVDMFAVFFEEMRSKNMSYIVAGDLNGHSEYEWHKQKMVSRWRGELKDARKSGVTVQDEAMWNMN